ncbi:3-coathanger stack domain-containing protein [Lacihabitans lacunae]|uniref:3-coathanger stack domain-containing protein n=1 Tax=Lacihabitans lacunae TaxID=1028214 RepID=A0ABV7YQ47_9BACT
MKRIISTLLLLCSQLYAFAQLPPNATCASPVVLTPGSSCSPTAGNSSGLTETTYDGCDFYKYKVWYKFTASATTQVIQVSRGTIQNIFIDIFEEDLSTDCENYNRVGFCEYSTHNEAEVQSVKNGLVVGKTYLISVSTLSTDDLGTFNICVFTPTTPTNDDCAGAVTLTVNPSNVPSVKTTSSTYFATQSQAACSGNADDDVWFKFTATQTSHRVYVQETSNNSSGVILEVFSGVCGSLFSKQCITSGFGTSENASAKLTSLTVGQTYFIRVHTSGLNDNTNFNIGITSKPLNDNCPEAVALTVGTVDGFQNPQTGNSIDATLSSNDCNNSTATDDDVWYTFTATQKVHRIKLKGWTSNFGRIEAFSGTCNALVSLGCTGFSLSGDTTISTYNNLIAGQTYFFRVYSASTTSIQSSFLVTVTSPNISTIDDCTDAQLVSVSNNSQCTNTLVSSKFALPSTISGTCYDTGNDIYLKFVATAIQHQIKIASQNSTSFNANFLSGTCGNFQTLGCRSSLDTNSFLGNLTIGQTYYIRIITFGNTSDFYNICITTPTFVSNDECAGAQTLTPKGDAITCFPAQGNFQNSSQSFYKDCGASPSLNSNLYKDVWYKFTATAAYQRFRMAKTSGQNFKYELYGGTCGALIFMECPSSITTFSEKTFSNLTPGQTYFIRVYTNSDYNVEFEHCLKKIVPPLNDNCTGATPLTVFATWNSLNNTGGSTHDAITSPGTNTCGQANAYAVYYSFIANNPTQNIAFSQQANNINLNGMVVAVYSGVCESLTPISCKSAEFTNASENVLKVTNLNIGQKYIIKVYSSTASIANQGFFNIQVNSQTSPPSNDDCMNAETLHIAPKANQISYKEGNTIQATSSTEGLICTSIGTADDDIWYKFTATKSRIRVLLTSNYVSPSVAIYGGTCGSLVSNSCQKTDLSSDRKLNKVIENLVVGQTYLIRVFSSANSATVRGFIKIGLSEDTDIPLNDICDNAIALNVSTTNIPNFVNGNTENAKAETGTCSGGPDVFYKFTATATSQRINYEGYIQGVKICLLSGTCVNKSTFASMTAIHGNAMSASGLTVGAQYYISIGSNSGVDAVGNFKIAVSTPTVPQNDLCSNAIPLVQGSYHTTNLATADQADCYYKPKSDVWFTMTATHPKMKVIVENLNTNSAITVYRGNCGALTQVACTYVAELFTLKNNILNLSALTVGETYFVRVITTGEAGTYPNFYEVPLEFRIYTEPNPEPNENPLYDLSCLGTNLLPNPGFEYFVTCPTNYIPSPSTPGQWLSPNNFWKIPTMGSSDYFNDCADFDAPIENPRNNTFGTQNPRNGTANGGIFTGGPSGYREYLSTPLTSPLVIGKKYLLSMYVSRADYYAYASNNLGFGLNIEEKSVVTLDTLVVNKVILPTQNNVIFESENWVNISASFVADQAYTHLFLGNFSSEKNTISQAASDISGGNSGGYNSNYSDNAYYFIDDVLVTEIQNSIACGANDCNSILVLSSPTDDISGGSVTKSSNLEIKANIIIQGNANTIFNSGKSILIDGHQGVFEAKQGVVFEAKIGGCGN